MADHVHMCISIPPKYPVSQVVGYLKGKCAIEIAKNFRGRQRKLQWRAFLGKRVFCLNSRA